MVHHLSLKRMKKLAVKSLHLIIKRMIRPRAFQGQHHIRYSRKTSVAKTQQNQTLCNLARFPDYKQFFLLCFRRFLGFFLHLPRFYLFPLKDVGEKVNLGRSKKRIKILLRTVSITVDSHTKKLRILALLSCNFRYTLNAYACITLAIKRGLMSYLEAVDKVCLQVSLRT